MKIRILGNVKQRRHDSRGQRSWARHGQRQHVLQRVPRDLGPEQVRGPGGACGLEDHFTPAGDSEVQRSEDSSVVHDADEWRGPRRLPQRKVVAQPLGVAGFDRRRCRQREVFGVSELEILTNIRVGPELLAGNGPRQPGEKPLTTALQLQGHYRVALTMLPKPRGGLERWWAMAKGAMRLNTIPDAHA